MGLLIPHFSLGLGIGTLDAALIPYMATLVDLKYGDDESTASKFFAFPFFLQDYPKHTTGVTSNKPISKMSAGLQIFFIFHISGDTISSYGSVYAIQQISVSLAYSLGPIFGGEMAQYFGFYWLMLIVGTLNILYGLTLLVLLVDWKSNVNEIIQREQEIFPHFWLQIFFFPFFRIHMDLTKKFFSMNMNRLIRINDFITAWMYHKRKR